MGGCWVNEVGIESRLICKSGFKNELLLKHWPKNQPFNNYSFNTYSKWINNNNSINILNILNNNNSINTYSKWINNNNSTNNPQHLKITYLDQSSTLFLLDSRILALVHFIVNQPMTLDVREIHHFHNKTINKWLNNTLSTLNQSIQSHTTTCEHSTVKLTMWKRRVCAQFRIDVCVHSVFLALSMTVRFILGGCLLDVMRLETGMRGSGFWGVLKEWTLIESIFEWVAFEFSVERVDFNWVDFKGLLMSNFWKSRFWVSRFWVSRF